MDKSPHSVNTCFADTSEMGCELALCKLRLLLVGRVVVSSDSGEKGRGNTDVHLLPDCRPGAEVLLKGAGKYFTHSPAALLFSHICNLFKCSFSSN